MKTSFSLGLTTYNNCNKYKYTNTFNIYCLRILHKTKKTKNKVHFTNFH